jgi:ATP-dependent DNA helicase RecQ
LEIGASKLTGLVNLLERVQAIEVTARGDLRYAQGGPPPAQAVARAVELDESRRRVDDSRIDMMRGYAETTGCRRRFLLEYFGEPYPGACGNCGTCRAGTAVTIEPADDGPFPVHAGVVHSSWGAGMVMRAEPDRVTVLFEDAGYKTLSLEAIRRDDLLSLAPE